MNKKSFLRGFGVGVLFSSVILGISFTVRTSDSYVKNRAQELGMEYSKKADDSISFGTIVSSSKPKNQESTKPKSTVKAEVQSTSEPQTTMVSQTAEPAKDDNTKAVSKKDANETEKEMKKEKDKLEKSIKDEEKKLTISVGDWSSDVCKKLENMGIVKNAADFDKYLNDNGYSKTITAGTYNVSIDDTYKELAKKISGKK